VQTDERRLELVRFATHRLNYVTTDRVRYAAATWLDDAKAFRLTIGPQATASAPAAADSPAVAPQ
jgi:hypothetical protein